MSSTVILPAEPEIDYPDCDGEPISDNTLQFKWIVTLFGGVSALFKDNHNVFVAGDLLWYPVQGDNTIRAAPDVMVAIGRPKGYRGSYMQWKEDNIPPQVVFEVLSPGNRAGAMGRKFDFYQRYGVEEYYIYDPDRISVEGFIRKHNKLTPIADLNDWVSPRLGIRFELTDDDLVIYRPDGQRFLDYLELLEDRNAAYRLSEHERLARDQAQKRGDEALLLAEEQRQAAELAQTRAASESRRADDAQQQAELERQRTEAEKQRADRLAAELTRLGIDPSTLN